MREYKTELSINGINKLINELSKYKESLNTKTELFVAKLLKAGISCAESIPGISGETGSHQFEQYVWYSKELNASKDGCLGVMYGHGTTLNVTWGADGDKSGSINTMIALEFGTAGKALPAQTLFGVTGGQGTNSYYGHADDTVWYFANGKDNKGNLIWKKATAITPTRPMMNAANEMISQIYTIAKEVFSQ